MKKFSEYINESKYPKNAIISNSLSNGSPVSDKEFSKAETKSIFDAIKNHHLAHKSREVKQLISGIKYGRDFSFTDKSGKFVVVSFDKDGTSYQSYNKYFEDDYITWALSAKEIVQIIKGLNNQNDYDVLTESKNDVYVQVVDNDGNGAEAAEGPVKDLEKLFKQALKNAKGMDWSYETPYFSFPDEIEDEAEKLEKKYAKDLEKL
jgi:uncharacterized FlaG/YvyC family protein